MTTPAAPPWPGVDELLQRALAEDLGLAGDVTSNATIPVDHVSTGSIVARSAGTVAGLAQATRVFALVDSRATVSPDVADGAQVVAGERMAVVSGTTRSVLAAERTCLNLLGHLCGVATVTAEMVRLVEGTGAQIVDTRKTLPGMRALQKYAVRCGGGANHRFGLDDAVLIKDNHAAAAGSLTAAIKAVRQVAGHMVKVEVEVDTLEQLDEILPLGVDAVLLDNMTTHELSEAVRRVGGQCVTEASGGITPATVREIAESGVDLISVGWLTHSVRQLDVGLDLVRAD